MNITLDAVDDTSCKIIERAGGTTVSNTIHIPASKDTVIAAIRELLADPEATDATVDNIMVIRMRDVLKLTAGILNVEIKWANVFPIALGA